MTGNELKNFNFSKLVLYYFMMFMKGIWKYWDNLTFVKSLRELLFHFLEFFFWVHPSFPIIKQERGIYFEVKKKNIKRIPFPPFFYLIIINNFNCKISFLKSLGIFIIFFINRDSIIVNILWKNFYQFRYSFGY